MSAAVWLHKYRESEVKKTKSTKQAVDQFMLASLDRPVRFKCGWQQQFFEGRSKTRRRGKPSQEMAWHFGRTPERDEDTHG